MVIGMPNPMVKYQNLEDIHADYPEIDMTAVPESASDIRYYVITGGAYPIAEILFTINGVEYTYRCSPCAGDPEATAGISGLYYEFDVNEAEIKKVNGASVQYSIHYCTADRIGHISTVDDESGCVYDISGQTDLATLKEAGNQVLQRNAGHTGLTGYVLDVGDGKIKVLTENGNTLVFDLTIEANVAAGDQIRFYYAGTLPNSVMLTDIEVLQHGASFGGIVSAHSASSVTVEAYNGNKISFGIDANTAVTGEASVIQDGAIVTVYYSGDLSGNPYVYEVVIEVQGGGKSGGSSSGSSSSGSGSSSSDDSLIDKTLKGTVNKLSDDSIRIKTAKGNKYTFKLTNKTKYTGDYVLEVGGQVTITYDGYASDSPLAKIVHIRSEAEPTPTVDPTPEYKSVSGVVTSVVGNWITLENGRCYTLIECTGYREGDCEVMNIAHFQYYKANGEYIVVEAWFEPYHP